MATPAIKLSDDTQYLVVTPGVESANFKLDSPTLDPAATTVLALASGGSQRVVTKTVPSGAIGNVTGPGSSTNTAIARWNGTSGTQLQDSVVTVSNSGAMAFPPGGGVSLPNGATPADSTLFNEYAMAGPFTIGNQTWTGPWLTAVGGPGWIVERLGTSVRVTLFIVPSLNNGAAPAVIQSVVPLPVWARPGVFAVRGTCPLVNASAHITASYTVFQNGVLQFNPTADPASTFPVGSTGLTGTAGPALATTAVCLFFGVN
jgi:hypothetical protein